MADRHVNFTSGNDSNDGSTPALAKLTPAGVVAITQPGDRILAEGTLPRTTAGFSLSGRSDLTVRQRHGGLKWRMTGTVMLAAASWSNHSGNAYKQTVTETSSNVVGVCVGFGNPANLDVYGRQKCMLQKASSLADCIATDNTWWHESNTLYVNLAGTDPATLTSYPIEWMHLEGIVTTGSAIVAQNCTRCTFSGAEIRNLHCVGSGIEPYAFIGSGTDNVVELFETHNVGRHHIGFVDSGVGRVNVRNTIRNCRMWGGGSSAIAGTQSVFYLAENDVIDGLVEDCVYHTYQLLDVAGVQFGSAVQDGAYGHTNGTTLVRSLTYRRCAFYQYLPQIQGSWANCGNTVTPSEADGWTPTAYPVQYYDCNFVCRRGVQRILSVNSAYVRCLLDNTLYGQGGNYANNFVAFRHDVPSSNVIQSILFQSSFLVTDLNLATGSHNAAVMHFYNTSAAKHSRWFLDHSAVVNNNSGNGGTTIGVFQQSAGATAGVIKARKTVIVAASTGTLRRLMYNDSSGNPATANLQFDDCLYFGVSTTLYSQDSTRNSEAEWTSLIDPTGIYGVNPGYALPQSPDKASPQPLPGSELSLRTLTPIAADAPVGINRRRNSGHYGPWQYGAAWSENERGGGGRRARRIAHFMKKAG